MSFRHSVSVSRANWQDVAYSVLRWYNHKVLTSAKAPKKESVWGLDRKVYQVSGNYWVILCDALCSMTGPVLRLRQRWRPRLHWRVPDHGGQDERSPELSGGKTCCWICLHGHFMDTCLYWSEHLGFKNTAPVLYEDELFIFSITLHHNGRERKVVDNNNHNRHILHIRAAEAAGWVRAASD